MVHNETSTGCMSNIREVREAIDQSNHGALLMVDTISSLASSKYCHDAWGVDVTVAGSQKGLMLPPGLSFNAVSERALSASKAQIFLHHIGRGMTISHRTRRAPSPTPQPQIYFLA